MGSGNNTITVDSVVGLQVDDVVAAAGIPGNTTISNINSGTKVITISNNTTAGITTSSQLTITHAKDTNTDRGISFNYNTSSGTGNNKLGFFGMDDSATADTSMVVENGLMFQMQPIQQKLFLVQKDILTSKVSTISLETSQHMV